MFPDTARNKSFSYAQAMSWSPLSGAPEATNVSVDAHTGHQTYVFHAQGGHNECVFHTGHDGMGLRQKGFAAKIKEWAQEWPWTERITGPRRAW